MEFCIQCGHKLCGKQTVYCSKECTNAYIRLKKINDKIQANKIFSDNTSVTIFPKIKNRTKRLLVIETISYDDKAFLNWWIKQFKLKRVYEDKTLSFIRNGTFVTRTLPALALCVADLEKLVNKIELKMKKTHKTELKDTIKHILKIRERFIEKLKG